MKENLEEYQLGFKGMDVIMEFFLKSMKLNDIRTKFAFVVD